MSWIEDMGKILGTSEDVIEQVNETLGKVMGNQHPSPDAIPGPASKLEEESKPAQADGASKSPTQIKGEMPSWLLPVGALVAVLLIMR